MGMWCNGSHASFRNLWNNSVRVRVSSFPHKGAYKDFLENNEKYCRGNYTPRAFKKDFLKEQGGKCLICGSLPIHNNKKLNFVLDHIDGDASNNKRDNLRMICPNCDSQIETFKSKNKHSTRRNYWREHLIQKITEGINNGQGFGE